MVWRLVLLAERGEAKCVTREPAAVLGGRLLLDGDHAAKRA